MHILGIVGGIASGKSVVSAALAELGAVLLDADKAAHEVLQHDDVKQALVSRWGTGILTEHGQINRQAVAKRIFPNGRESSDRTEIEADRQFLEQTVHPRIRQQFQRKIDQLESRGVAVAVIDAPLLLEAGWGEACNDIVFVDCPADTRLERALSRGWTKRQFLEREAAQWPIKEKQHRSTLRIDNSGKSKSQLAECVRRMWDRRWAAKS